MPFVTVSSSSSSFLASGKATIRWVVTNEPTAEKHFKGTIHLQRYGGSKQFRFLCEGQFYVNGLPYAPIGDNGAPKTTTVPLPTDSYWNLRMETMHTSSQVEVKKIDFLFTNNNDDGIYRIHLLIPQLDDGGSNDLVGAIHHANQEQNLPAPIYPQDDDGVDDIDVDGDEDEEEDWN